MEEKTTDDLSQELMSKDDIDSYIKENRFYFSDRSISELLNTLYDKKDISKASLARKAGMSEVYLHQVFSGRRKPSRDKLLCLCVGLGATLDETSVCSGRQRWRRFTPRTSGTPSSALASPTIWS